ncbi:hypothetical protein COY26_02370 [Candidatus Woesearchaeota archaeon CG_4_10_14_0_2_um_filter_33_10]|nr:MAG: hypothetical protein AUJ83_04870 [Candidatus Woesearchaeota archaeon CG1_02_33_12]PIU72892.1 MAG: hypothetical protein COS79_00645 [Candidatus Woesearchaeota archaeon CG06_land_8_20_14_3_00_33_13]PIZ53251.1 MAG: hypothetical protein COY26_02370 [Candidatus Woesearchaeota archaeon CG_4_10_14_0_2_um_filter_33_10]
MIMLKRILDTTKIDIDDPGVKYDLETDLRRMDRMKHDEAPKNIEAYKVKVEPSVQTYMPGFHRFRFKFQYGKLIGDKFVPIGKPIKKQSENLPYLD